MQYPDSELFYLMMLQRVKGVGPLYAHRLLSCFSSAYELFTQEDHLLAQVPRLGKELVLVKHDTRLKEHIQDQLDWASQYHVRVFGYSDPEYPARMRECVDAPLVLFSQGQPVYDRKYMLSVVGTRHSTPYGKHVVEKLIEELTLLREDLTIVSGLAYGTDVNAHQAALRYHIPTLGVLAHGLDQLYPQAHLHIAQEMLEQGGLLSEYPPGTKIERQNFLSRNRIIAGLSDATLLIESADKGGAIVTANIANTYNREVLAIPGRIGDPRSVGCNRLICRNQASLITCADDLLSLLGWKEHQEKVVEPELFRANADEQRVLDLLHNDGEQSLQDLIQKIPTLSVQALAGILLDLELENLIYALPGSRYTLG